jgi:hypothetical protein
MLYPAFITLPPFVKEAGMNPKISNSIVDFGAKLEKKTGARRTRI